MKKIGILFGMENTFPNAFIERVNSKGEPDIIAEAVTIDKVAQAAPTEYAVIIDRISQDVPFYRAYLKNAALCGTAVINNPFWWSADEKFFNNALAEQIGVPVPKTVLLPSKQRPDNTTETSFRNLAFPMAWEEIFQYVGFPAYMKPHDGGGWKSVYKVVNPQDLWYKHEETGQLVMMLQEEIEFSDYVRCYCIGQKDVLIMPYEPRNPHHLRYASELKATGEEREKLLETIKDYTLRLNKALGYDFNTVEFAVRDGIPYAIDFCNPAPDADIYSVGPDNFEWVVEAAANMAIERAKAQVPGQVNLTWGTFLSKAVQAGITAPGQQVQPVPLPSATEVNIKAVTPKKSVKKPAAGTSEPVAEPDPQLPTNKAAVTKAPAKNSKMKKS
ncbi:ATP-grasp domain-containing protein [Dyadobacter sp.]|uniref:ATP-grasp domain-containing protein n=1 Tax=Dyadobacter sp. TaxID=1914288 RepID=UPI003F726866